MSWRFGRTKARSARGFALSPAEQTRAALRPARAGSSSSGGGGGDALELGRGRSSVRPGGDAHGARLNRHALQEGSATRYSVVGGDIAQPYSSPTQQGRLTDSESRAGPRRGFDRPWPAALFSSSASFSSPSFFSVVTPICLACRACLSCSPVCQLSARLGWAGLGSRRLDCLAGRLTDSRPRSKHRII